MTICENCKRAMFVKNPKVDIGIPVLDVDIRGQPYKLVYGDRLTCLGCGHSIIANFGGPTMNYADDFEEQLAGARQHPQFMEVK